MAGNEKAALSELPDIPIDEAKEILDSIDKHAVNQTADRDAEWLPTDEEFNRYSAKRRERQRKKVCKQLWDLVVINWNGGMAPCCQVYLKKQHFAHSFPEDFRAFWNGPEYVAARKLFGPERPAQKLGIVCEKCVELGNLV